MNGKLTLTLTPKEPKVPEARKPSENVVAMDIGRTGRRLAAIPSTQTALNSLIAIYGGTTLARSRYLSLNNPYAVSAKETFMGSLVGRGIKPSHLSTDKAERTAVNQLFADWVPYADADGILDFYGLQALGASELFEAGEFFLVYDQPAPGTPAGVVPLGVRLYQAEMLPHWEMGPTTQPLSGNRISMGIEFDQNNRRVAYHFLQAMPLDMAADPLKVGTVRIPAEQVLHVYRPIRAGQIRGIPFTLSGMVTLAMMDLYDDAELERKRTAALFSAFVTMHDPEATEADSPLGAPGNLHTADGGRARSSVSMEPGAVVTLTAGEDVKFAQPADLGQSYEAFQYRMLLRAAAGFGVPYSSFTGDMRQVNYSSMRHGLLEFRRRISAMQDFTMVHMMVRPVWNKLLNAATLAKLTPWSPTDFSANMVDKLRAKFLAPKWEWVDPLKDLQAEKLAVDNGFKPRSDVIEESGDDPEETDNRIHADRKRAEELAKDLDGPLFGDPLKGNPIDAPANSNNAGGADNGPPSQTQDPPTQGN